MKKKFMAAFLAVCMIATMLVIPANAASFPDTDGHWAASSIERWSDEKVLNGNADGTFNPDGTMTRAEYVKFLAENLLGYSAKAENVFTDVPAGIWYEDAVLKAVAAGVTNGTSATTFGPTNPVTFEQASVLMFRALGLVKVVGGSNYADDTNKLLAEMEGVLDENVNANGDCSRAVVAALADRVIGEYVTSDTVIDKDVKGVVVAVNGAKVEIKDATVSASIVAADGASVTLTNATAGNVVVGDKATVTADEKSTVKDVTMIGDAPKADIKGSVDSLTVGETATGAVADVPAGTTTENKSSSEATINGETVGGSDANETPDNTAKDPELGDGAIVDGGTEIDPNHKHSFTIAVAKESTNHVMRCSCGQYKKADGTATQDVAEAEAITCAKGAAGNTFEYLSTTKHKEFCACGHELSTAETGDDHNVSNNDTCACGYVLKVTAGDASKHVKEDGTAMTEEEINTAHAALIPTVVDATCTAKGSSTQTCKTCGWSQKTETPALGHTAPSDPTQVTDTATCSAAGLKTYTCTVCGVQVRENSPVNPSAHNMVATRVAGTDTHVMTCSRCKTTSGDAVACTFGTPKEDKNQNSHTATCACGNTKTSDHTFTVTPENKVTGTSTTHTIKCVCGATKTENHTWVKGEVVSGGEFDGMTKYTCACGDVDHRNEHVHSWSGTYTTDATAHWHECTASDCDVTENASKDGYGEHGSWKPLESQTNGKTQCGTCGYETDCHQTHTTEGDEAYTCSECGYSFTPASNG